MLLFIEFLNLVICFCVKNNSWGNGSLLKFLAPNLSVVPSLLFTAVFNLLNYKFVNLAFIVLYSTILYLVLMNFHSPAIKFQNGFFLFF